MTDRQTDRGTYTTSGSKQSSLALQELFGADPRLPQRPGREGAGNDPPGMEIYELLSLSRAVVNKPAGSRLAITQELTTNQKLGQQVDTTLDMTTTDKFPP